LERTVTADGTTGEASNAQDRVLLQNILAKGLLEASMEPREGALTLHRFAAALIVLSEYVAARNYRSRLIRTAFQAGRSLRRSRV